MLLVFGSINIDLMFEVRRSHIRGKDALQPEDCASRPSYVLLAALRRIGLRHTQFATASRGTIRLKLRKIGAQVPKGVRRIAMLRAAAARPKSPSDIHVELAPRPRHPHSLQPPNCPRPYLL